MFWLTIISSIASIVSLGLAFLDYFVKWRTYILCVGCLMAGMAIGIIMSMNESVAKSLTQEQLLHLILLISIVSFSLIVIVLFKKVIEDTEGGMALVVFIIILVFASFIWIGSSFSPAEKKYNPNDYLVLYNHYYSMGDYTKCADFLKEYKSEVWPNLTEGQNDSLDNLIKSLYYKNAPLK